MIAKIMYIKYRYETFCKLRLWPGVVFLPVSSSSLAISIAEKLLFNFGYFTGGD